MKEHISFDPVEGVAVAIALEPVSENEPAWSVFLINNNQHELTNVLITSKGYGEHEGEMVKTSVLRHMFAEVGPKEAVKVEPIDPGIFHLTNEYWVSYYVNEKIYDKKYIFVPGTMLPENLTEIALLGSKGVLHT